MLEFNAPQDTGVHCRFIAGDQVFDDRRIHPLTASPCKAGYASGANPGLLAPEDPSKDRPYSYTPIGEALGAGIPVAAPTAYRPLH